MTAKEHYDKHLGNFYSWMTGDFEPKQEAFQTFLKENAITPLSTKVAIDLGAGHGLQSVPLARIGFNVIAVDFNKQLLDELEINARGLNIEIVNDDIRNVKAFANKNAELVVCCGDTLSHLDSKQEINNLITETSKILPSEGKILLSFRDYSKALTGDDRFISVKSDGNRILTCVLDYEQETVRVTDLLHEKTETGWKQSVSSYNKVRISTAEIITCLERNGMTIRFNEVIKGMTTLIGVKQR